MLDETASDVYGFMGVSSISKNIQTNKRKWNLTLAKFFFLIMLIIAYLPLDWIPTHAIINKSVCHAEINDNEESNEVVVVC